MNDQQERLSEELGVLYTPEMREIDRQAVAAGQIVVLQKVGLDYFIGTAPKPKGPGGEKPDIVRTFVAA